MNIPSKSVRFSEFVGKLKAERAATGREDAVMLMKKVMKLVEDAYGLPDNDFDRRMNVFALNANMGWMNLDTDPCYWDDNQTKIHRTEVYKDGRIVISRNKAPIAIVLDKAGA
ncbi:MAG: hypothetical protein V4542_13895 [Pseudomonadota bacterium]